MPSPSISRHAVPRSVVQTRRDKQMKQTRDRLKTSDHYVSSFFIARMLQVFKGDRAGIVEYFLVLFERDTMLFGILLGFIFVPFEMHRLQYIHIRYIFNRSLLAGRRFLATSELREQLYTIRRFIQRILVNERVRSWWLKASQTSNRNRIPFCQ